jgi:alpha-galactosidase
MLVLLAMCAISGSSLSHSFPPGWNSEARTPPLGWRSWNAFGNHITQDMMRQAMDALAAANRTIRGKANQSLCKDIGFCSAGLDEGWEACGVGTHGTQHDANGLPTINTTRFPSLKNMVNYGHSLGLKVGWYQNGCKCAEQEDVPLNYAGDIELLYDYGFDGVKMDDCGHQRNMTLYAGELRTCLASCVLAVSRLFCCTQN